MNALLVHGMGRASIEWWPNARRLRKNGIGAHTFGYSVFLQSIDAIAARLVKRLIEVAALGPYVAVGHSLGGVLLRLAISKLPADVPRPERLFLLGSPMRPARLARFFRRSLIFPFLSRDAGRLLASDERMAQIPAAPVPVTAVIGTKGWTGRFSPFGCDPNDLIVAVNEAESPAFDRTHMMSIIHSTMATSRRVADVLIREITALPSAGAR